MKPLLLTLFLASPPALDTETAKQYIDETMNSYRVWLECTVTEDRRLKDCIVVAEKPEPAGYGQKAIEYAHTKGRDFDPDSKPGRATFMYSFPKP